MKHLPKLSLILMVMMLAVAYIPSTAQADKTTITGEVNDNYQIVAGAQIYEIADTAEGNELAENHIGAKVKIVGSIENHEDVKIITVVSYQLVSE